MSKLYIDNTYLEHHGILGQKWGKRQGPPYPLDASDHSASEKKAGWKESLKASYKQHKEQRKHDKEASKFNYRKHESFKNNRRDYQIADVKEYNLNKAMYGRKRANRIEYEARVEGKDRKEIGKREYKRAVKKGIANTAVRLIAPAVLSKGAQIYLSSYMKAQMASAAAAQYGAQNGLQTIKGGYSIGAGSQAVRTGEAIAKKILNGR